MTLYEALKEEMHRQSEAQSMRINVTLTGAAAESFLALHAKLGGPGAITKSELASQILTRALDFDATHERRPRRIKNTTDASRASMSD